jgi:hypothetical protein
MNHLLTDLGFIKTGAVFPPANQLTRLNYIDENLRRNKGTYNETRKLVITLEEGQVVLPLNILTSHMFKLITDKQLSLLLNEKPVVSHVDKMLTKQLHAKIANVNFWFVVGQSYKSMSVTGTGVFNVYKDDRLGGAVNWVNPKVLYKIPSPHSLQQINNYTFAQEIYESEINNGVYSSKVTHIRFITHYVGKYFEIVYLYNAGKLGEPVEYILDKETNYVVPKGGHFVETGLSDFAVHTIENSLPIDEIYGISDYQAVEDFVLDQEKRATMFSMILDQNSRPYKILSIDLVDENEVTGKQEIRSDGGTYIKRRDGDSKPIELVSVDIKVDAYKTHMEWAGDGIATSSELGHVFLNAEFSNASGEALKTLLKGPLDKVSRQIDSMEFQIKSVLCSMMELDGVDISPSDIDITWQDGITESPKTIAETMEIRLRSGTISKQSAIQRMDSKSPEQSAEELDIIKKEQEGSVVPV